MLKCQKEIAKRAKYYLYNYKEIKEKIETAKEDMIMSRKTYFSTLTNQGYYSNPVENAILKFDKKYGEDEKWLKVIDDAYDIVRIENHLKYQFMLKRFYQKEPWWKIMKELHIEKSTFYTWEKEIVSLVIMLAIQHKLVKIDLIQPKIT